MAIAGERESSPRTGKSGLAFDVVLEPAHGDAPAGVKNSPRVEKVATQEEIERKLREAEERREKMEQERRGRLKSENDERIEKIREKLSAEEAEHISKQKGELSAH